MSVAAVIRDLRTAPNLACEVVRVLDSLAQDDARELFKGKTPQPLPLDADWLTRHHYAMIKAARDKVNEAEQARAWDEYMKLQQQAK